MIENIAIKITNIAYGNENIEFVFDGTVIPFYASYIGNEPISTLIQVAEELPNNNNAQVEFLDEPGYMKIDFTKDDGSDELSIDIEIEDKMPEDAENPVKYHIKTRYEVFKTAVIKAAIEVLTTYGMVGFMHSWLERANVFPVGELLSLLGISSVHHEESDSFRTNLKDEMQLLLSATENDISDREA